LETPFVNVIVAICGAEDACEDIAPLPSPSPQADIVMSTIPSMLLANTLSQLTRFPVIEMVVLLCEITSFLLIFLIVLLN
jgi:hypothetical protein